MLLMSTTTSMVLLCQSTFNNLLVSANSNSKSKSSPTSFSFSLSFSLFSSQKNYTKSSKRSRLCSSCSSIGSYRSRSRRSSLVPNAKERKKTRKQSWWYKFFLDDDGNWLGLKEDDMQDLVEQVDEDDDDDINSNDDDSKFEAWKQRAEAITELREAQEDIRNQEARSWEDWLAHDDGNGSGNGIGTFDSSSSSSDWFNFSGGNNGLPPQSTNPPPQNGLVRSVRNFLLGNQDDSNDDDDDDDADLLYEDRVFRYASINSAKFLVVLIFVPWALDFLFHDYLLMPFLDRYVKTVPLAAQMLDVRRNQKLEIIEQLKMEKARLRLEVQIGRSPPLSDDQAWWELRDKALELREEKRLQNRGAFANIWSDMVFGISLFILLYSNQSKVALLKFTGYKIINNISDTGKAFLIILITDIFLGYHSESGWQTLLEIIVEHYGLEVDQSAITIFICLVPVVIDACVKLWLFKFLPRLSPKVANIFREMKRH